MIEFTCKGCRHFTREPESEATRRKICMHCNAQGIDLPQLRKVEKWEARDGSLHDSAEAAADYQLRTEIARALKASDRHVDDQARHLLSHFDVRRKGDAVSSVVLLPAYAEPTAKGAVFYFIQYAATLTLGAFIGWQLHGAWS